MTATTHRVRQRPQLRALGLAAAVTVVGLVLMLMSHLLNWSIVLAMLGVLALLLGVGLLAASIGVARSMGVDIVLDDDGYQVLGPNSREVGRWADVASVTGGDGSLTVHRKDGSSLRLVMSRTSVADIDALHADIARRLDADRGYHNL